MRVAISKRLGQKDRKRASKGVGENVGGNMSVDQTDKIDFLWKDEQSEHVMLTITDHLDWKKRDEGEHLSLLQEKINTYLHFIESGQVWKAKPEYKGLPVIIHVRAKYRPSKEAAKFYKLAEKGVAAGGASLVFDHAP
jgi:hypothetical protein